MKQKALSIISVISVIGLIVCLFEIVSLQGEIDDLNRTISNQNERFNREVNSIYSNVDEKLKKQASILSEKSLEYGEKDLQNRTVEIICTVVPKEYTPGKTTAVLVLDGKEIEELYNVTDRAPITYFINNEFYVEQAFVGTIKEKTIQRERINAKGAEPFFFFWVVGAF